LKKKLLTLSWILILTIFISGCGKELETSLPTDKTPTEDKNIGQVDTEDIPEAGGQVLAPLTNFNTLNPLLTDNSSYYHFSKLIFEGLFEFDDNLKPVPLLAEDYQIKDGGRTVAIRLRSDVLWHDGEKLTSQDVAFTIEAIKQAGTEATYGKIFQRALGQFDKFNLHNIIKVRPVDDLNLEIVFDKVYSNNLEVLTFPIVASHRLKGQGKATYTEALREENYKPIGTGPYKFVDYERFKNVYLEKNPDYWKGSPYIDKIVGKVLADNELILNAFETGQINLAISQGVDWAKYRQNKRIEVLEFISGDYEFLGFNFKNKLLGSQKGQAIRQAINYAIDRQDIIERVYLKHATQIDVPIHPDSYLISKYAHSYGHNKEMAKEILKKAGFTNQDKDGTLIDEEGNKLSFTMITNSFNPLRIKTMEIIREDLNKVGIDIKIASPIYYNEDELTDEFIDKEWAKMEDRVKKGDFDIVLLGWNTSVITDLTPMFHSQAIKAGDNFISYENEKMDQLLERAYFSSREGKEKAFESLQELIVEDLPYLSLVFRNRGLLIDKKIKGDLNPNFYNLYKGLENCYIPKDLQ